MSHGQLLIVTYYHTFVIEYLACLLQMVEMCTDRQTKQSTVPFAHTSMGNLICTVLVQLTLIEILLIRISGSDKDFSHDKALLCLS